MTASANRAGRRLWLRYPWVTGTVAVAALTLLLLLFAPSWSALWVASAYAIAVAIRSAVAMIRALRAGSFGIDLLAISAILSTVVLGDYWAALVVVLMLTSGEALEDFASRRAESELRALIERAPRVAHRERDGSILDVPVDDVVVGDVVEVHPGEVVPVDGQMLGEGASLDESSLTGESLPVWRGPGADVASGAVNGGGVIRIRATVIARDSQYQQIVALVRAAAGSKAPFVRLADRVSVPFTIGAFVLAGVAWGLSGEAVRFAEVLVVATPCPLLIAAPVAFIAGMSRAAASGVIIKSGGVLERLARVRTVAFDKTGTLTQGAVAVSRIDSLGAPEREILAAAAAVEADSAHILARAVVAEATTRNLTFPAARNVVETTAHGISGTVGERTVTVGRPAFVDGAVSPSWPALRAGEMAVYVGFDGSLVGRLVLMDTLRSEARETLDRLRALGVRHTLMLTGDSRETAAAIASQVGVDEFDAEMLPAGKVEAIRHTEGPVMMVGDGVNDAPVLAVADVGVAMGARGATAASESADVVVLVEDLGRTATVIEIAQRTMRIALQSIGIGIGLSIVLMVVAGFGVIPPIIGATLQEFVDLVAILNSLRAGRALRLPIRSSDRVPALRP